MMVDYSFYLIEFLNVSSECNDGLTKQEFIKYERRAEMMLSSITLQRVNNKNLFNQFSYQIKMCLCALTEYCSNPYQGRVTSESTDGHSVTYSNTNEDAQVYQIVKNYLSSTPLIYGGFNIC